MLFAQGGLGNQMFNYAAARSLADRAGVDLLIDLESYREQWDSDATRPFLLKNFPVRAAFRNVGELHLKQSIFSRLVRRWNEDWLSVCIERAPNEIAYFTRFGELGGKTVLKGHFIDCRFFLWNSLRLIDDLRLSGDILNDNSRGMRLITEINAAECSVSIHVRRGDLLDKNNRWLLLDRVMDYYKKSMMAMSARHPNASYWVFSDDAEWCRGKFSGQPYNVKVIERSSDPMRDILVDFFLMSNCKHNIIANSAFSWWAAFLNRNQNKTVMVPYIYDKKNNIPIDQIIPPKWEKIIW